MESFRLHRLQLAGRHYLLLPRLNPIQTEMLATRLSGLGFEIKGDAPMVANSKGVSLHVYPSGFCWSSIDPTDLLVPAVPEILRVPRLKSSLEQVRSSYFRVFRKGGRVLVRFATRVESGRLWGELRAGGECGLTPDEFQTASFLIRSSSGSCNMLTDFPAEKSEVMVIGNRLYYDSRLTPVEAAETLRTIGMRHKRNSYLPRNGLLEFDSMRLPSLAKQATILNGLGEWCYFIVAPKKL